ncbi:TM1266 family iron-only hydrogenase system putative regulator [Fusibacter sp. JL216-2]|uniref:TM1266 family iron-only hydrogenase system putative regulator n=1 Tax=Fusibacter sp. JL216-2 TaxID=3071453 RepID=UPI003D34E78D
MKRVAVVGIVLDEPKESNAKLNEIIAEYKDIVRGRMGIPFNEEGISVISLTIVGSMNEINSLTGKLGNVSGVSVKTSISKKEIQS